MPIEVDRAAPAADGGGALELRELVKHYRGAGETVRAVDGVGLTIEPGELVALYGPSGSGKSTLLSMAAALLAPDSGAVVFNGREVSAMSGRRQARYRRREVGLVSQELHLMPGATALDNALIKLPVLGLTLRQARAHTMPWLARLGIADRAGHLPHELSHGERQRVAIARALAAEPRLLLADEPTGSLDTARTEEILALLAELCRERGMPGLLVTHDPEAVSFADRAITLRDGRLVDDLDRDAQPHSGRAPAAASGRAGGVRG